MAVDNYGASSDSLISGSLAPYEVTPHDTNPLAVVPKALEFGTSGNVAFRAVNGSADIIWPVVAGQILRVRVSHVRSTGTTVTRILAHA